MRKESLICNKAPWITQYLDDPVLANSLNYGSNKYVDCHCIYCGFHKKMRVSNLYYYGFKCPKCGDSTHYPEKFMINFLDELKIKYIYQLNNATFQWCGKYQYDFYVPKYNMIIEVDGEQHTRKGFNTIGGKTIELQQLADKEKELLALENGISKYIHIECSKVDMNEIKNSILSSELSKLCNISVNWAKISLLSLPKEVIDICNYYNEHKELTSADIGKIFNKSTRSIITYLKNGTDAGICYYDKELMMKVGNEKTLKNRKTFKRPINMYKDGNFIATFESAAYLEHHAEELFGVKMDAGNIAKVLKGKKKTVKGYTFSYH